MTSVGIHERSSREKISHVMNGAAHIMNDEATRKYLQAIKRLLTFAQRAYPTDPSRCIDFDGFRNPSRGAAGGGSDKLVRLPDWHAQLPVLAARRWSAGFDVPAAHVSLWSTKMLKKMSSPVCRTFHHLLRRRPAMGCSKDARLKAFITGCNAFFLCAGYAGSREGWKGLEGARAAACATLSRQGRLCESAAQVSTLLGALKGADVHVQARRCQITLQKDRALLL